MCGPYSSDTQKLPSVAIARPSLSIPSGSSAMGVALGPTAVSPVPPWPEGFGMPESLVPPVFFSSMLDSF